MELFDFDIVESKKKIAYASHYVTYTFDVTENINDALHVFQNKEGVSKSASVERLIMVALKHLGILDENELPIDNGLNNTGRPSIKKGNVKSAGKLSVATHNALMMWKLGDENLKHNTKSVIMQKLLNIGLRCSAIQVNR